MSLSNIRYYFKEGFSNLWHNRVMTIASISSVIAALFMLGIFSAMILNVDNIVSQIESQIEIRAFLKDDLSEENIKLLDAGIKSVEGIKEVTYESKEQALENFKKQLGDRSDLLAGLEGDNPMPASFIIKTTSPQVIESVVNAIKGMEGIDQVRYGKDIVEKILNLTYVIRIISLVLIVILIIISVVIIYNTIRITVYARRREITIMRYVGATDWFIRWPFIIEGAVLGFAGTIAALAILRISYSYAVEYLTRSFFVFGLLPASVVIDNIFLMLLSIGLIIGIMGSTLSIHRFLKV
ncbi:MAG: permease-like cell division protein FtsX [Thermoanaerobacteraceae bacterium]|nr:permease-like cell division protein FtsX [Thermoanaerobacteraceae bacterium]